MPEDAESVNDAEREGGRCLKIANAHCAQLTEHFDTVQIICTKQTPEGTALTISGQGNWYARRESCREFLKQK